MTRQEFEQAWHDRDQPVTSEHPEYGPYFEGYGYTDSGRPLYLVWRWQEQTEEHELVWPITAYQPDFEGET